eukprot:scaffold476_cov77-Skeletonema_marinoi.AAC.16
MDCDDCDLVRYCSEKCQQEHRPYHELLCKERAAELRDEILFRQPERSHRGDCPICFLPLSIDQNQSKSQSCCSEAICKGCSQAHKLQQLQQRQYPTCPFCRHPVPKSQEEANKNMMKRAVANDPAALSGMGRLYYNEREYETAFDYLTKAAALGDADAHFNVSLSYLRGEGVEKDEKMRLYHLEEAAIAGHPTARYNLACIEMMNDRFFRAVKHHIIAANLGYDDSIQMLKRCYKNGFVSKEDFAAALRGHQAAVDDTKSPQREAAS